MKSKIDFNEALKDSPTFRSVLDDEENDIEHLEQKIERVLKMCTTAVDSGKEYVKNNSAFATSLWDLQRHFKDDRTSHSALEKVIHCLQEMNKFHTILLDQASRTVLKNLTSFIKSEIKEVKDYKNLFLKVSENLDGALQKNAQVNKNKPTDVQETENYLSATKSCFQHTALDYVNILTMLQAKKKPEILSTLLSYVQACSTYYHQGSDLCEDFDPYFKVLADDICTMRSDCATLEKTMQNRHASVTNFDQGHTEGYLFKRTSKGFKTWNRRWFYIAGNQLLYRKRNGEESPTVMEEDLSICTVRLANECDRRFCFESCQNYQVCPSGYETHPELSKPIIVKGSKVQPCFISLLFKSPCDSHSLPGTQKPDGHKTSLPPLESGLDSGRRKENTKVKVLNS
uniref:Uncharacterized protein n=1 Tax=Phlebotomus papatasi TaxID=29031 RepID=A0A1B0D1X4_PHLPP